MFKLTFLLVMTFLTSCTSTGSNAIDLPADDKQRSFTLNLSMSTQKLYEAYMSSNVNQRRLAEMYIAGVLDSLEGTAWCDYSIASPSAIQEQVFSSLKSTVKNTPNMRASDAIRTKLEKLLPCEERK